ncbi:hypothetical protein HBB16_11290 [Pseudonocardia sp. MCCB 268]|nr:hypothetical protein [Pseudonocardia cytotoxica]
MQRLAARLGYGGSSSGSRDGGRCAAARHRSDAAAAVDRFQADGAEHGRGRPGPEPTRLLRCAGGLCRHRGRRCVLAACRGRRPVRAGVWSSRGRGALTRRRGRRRRRGPRRARRSLRPPGRSRPVDAADLLPERAPCGDPAARRRPRRGRPRSLHDAGGELLRTPVRVPEGGASLEGCACAVRTPSNTVRYRLRRIGELVGRSPTDLARGVQSCARRSSRPGRAGPHRLVAGHLLTPAGRQWDQDHTGPQVLCRRRRDRR